MLYILGIKINSIKKKEVLQRVAEIMQGKEQKYFVTPNPEIILQAQTDEELFFILNKADISLADGFGVKLAAKFLKSSLKRITGADLSKDLLSLAENKDYRVVIFNYKNGLSRDKDIAEALKIKYPKLKFLVQDSDRRGGGVDWTIVHAFKPQLAFCTFGGGYQEKFLYHQQKQEESIKLAIGVGGAFDFLTKKLHRSPRIFRSIGLEWLWRLIQQPWRIRRIYRAIFVFSYKFFLWRWVRPYVYRPNVACLVYKQGDNGKKILILNRRHHRFEDNNEHWQIPQGGTDGEPLEKAARRELAEEANIKKASVRAVIKTRYKYRFVDDESVRKKWRWKGQKQDLVIFEFKDKEENIKVNFWEHDKWQWVDEDKFIETLHSVRQKAGAIYLQKLKKLEKN